MATHLDDFLNEEKLAMAINSDLNGVFYHTKSQCGVVVRVLD